MPAVSAERWKKMQLGRVFRRMGLPVWTFIGVGVASIWFNTVSSLAERVFSDLLGIRADSAAFWKYLPAFLTIAVPFLVVVVISQFLPRQTGIRIASGLSRPRQKKGLILLVSNLESAMFAIHYHFEGAEGRLEHVWLLPSNDTEAAFFGKNTRDKAQEIKLACETLATEAKRTLTVDVHPTGVSPADAQDTYDYVRRIYRGSGYAPQDLVADFTGGTKPMSVGMIMACLPTDRELEYVSLHSVSRKSHGPFLIDYQHTAFDLVG